MINPRNLYELLFYALYRWSEKIFGKGYSHVYSAALMVGTALLLNMLAIIILLYIAGMPIVSPSAVMPQWGWLVAAAIFFAAQYWYFWRNDYYRVVLERFESRSWSDNAVAWTGVAYVLISLVVLLVFVFVSV